MIRFASTTSADDLHMPCPPTWDLLLPFARSRAQTLFPTCSLVFTFSAISYALLSLHSYVLRFIYLSLQQP